MKVPFNDLRPDMWLLLDAFDLYGRVMRSGQYVNGQQVKQFENEWAEYVGAKHCVAVGSGSEALQLLVGIHPWRVALHCHRLCYSPPTLDAVRGSSCSVVEVEGWTPLWGNAAIVVHLHGIPQEVPEGPFVVEDCCQAHGARINGQSVGLLGHAAAWSFYPTKNLGGFGNAGAITTDKTNIANLARQYPGARMDELQAAFLRLKLRRLDEENDRRRAQAKLYMRELRRAGIKYGVGVWPERIAGVHLPYVPPGAEPCWHHFVIRHEARDELQAFLVERGIETMIHYPPDQEVLSLPIGPHLIENDIMIVAEEVNEWAEQWRQKQGDSDE